MPEPVVKAKDQIKAFAPILIPSLNRDFPDQILLFARYFGEVEAPVEANIVDIDSTGFSLQSFTRSRQEYHCRVAFREPLDDPDVVVPCIRSLANEAADGLGIPRIKEGTDWTPAWFWSIIVALVGVYYYKYYQHI